MLTSEAVCTSAGGRATGAVYRPIAGAGLFVHAPCNRPFPAIGKAGGAAGKHAAALSTAMRGAKSVSRGIIVNRTLADPVQ